MSVEQILLVEDDLELAEEVVAEFAHLNYTVVHIADGNAGLLEALSGSYCVVVLDIQLPGKNGFDICKELRVQEPLLPVLMLTTRTSEVDKILGFELGADDYITKPFSIRELVARVRTKIVRQSAIRSALEAGATQVSGPLLHIGEISLDLERRKVAKNGSPLELSAKEFDLLCFLMSHPGRVFTREELLHAVWGVSTVGYLEAVVAQIYRLRMKIETNPANPRYVLTVRGVGYSFAEDNDGK